MNKRNNDFPPVIYSWYAVLAHHLEIGLEQNACRLKTVGLIPICFAYFALSITLLTLIINFKSVPNGETNLNHLPWLVLWEYLQICEYLALTFFYS